MIASVIDPRRAAAIERRDAWNAEHPPGTFVRYWQSMPAGEWVIASTTGQAFVHGTGVAVHVRGTCQPVYLSNLAALSPQALEAILRPPPPHAAALPGRGKHLALPVGDRG